MSSLQRMVEFLWHISVKQSTYWGDTLVVSQLEIKKDGWMPEVKAYEEDLYINLLKRNTLPQSWIYFLNKIFQYKIRA